jgi:hypothetical protein
MRYLFHLSLDGFDDPRMGMADQRTHLSRCEIKDRPIIRIENEGAPGPLDNRRVEAPAITYQMSARGRPEGGIPIVRHCKPPNTWESITADKFCVKLIVLGFRYKEN